LAAERRGACAFGTDPRDEKERGCGL